MQTNADGENSSSNNSASKGENILKSPHSFLLNATQNNDQSNLEKAVYNHSSKSYKERDLWDNKFQFLLACIGSSVGLGNVWRFPYLCYKNGGGAFVAAYIILVFTIGYPLFLLEITLGQYTSLGPAHLYSSISPILKGVGLASIIASFIIGIYYNIIIGWTLHYIFNTINPQWETCDNEYNTEDCFSSLTSNKTRSNRSASSTEEYFNIKMLKISEGIEIWGEFNWSVMLSLMFAWIIVAFCLIKGIKSSGKVVYFTATFPYVILFLLFIRGITLTGATEGIKWYLIPDWNKLFHLSLWKEAAIQVFFSFSIASGSMLTYSSYNKFNDPILMHTLIISLVDLSTSLFAGIIIFSMLGFMAYNLQKEVPQVVDEGMGLAFIAIPEGLAQLNFSFLWSFLYFFMLFLLGIDTQFAIVETIVTFIIDTTRKHNYAIRKSNIVSFISIIMFLMGLLFCSGNGIYILDIVDKYAAGFPFLVIGFFECIIVVYIYGMEKFFDNLNTMCKWNPNIILKSHLIVAISTFVPCMLVFLAFHEIYINANNIHNRGKYFYPKWTIYLGIVFELIPLAVIPISAIIYLYYSNEKTFLKKLKNGFKIKPKFFINSQKHQTPFENVQTYQNNAFQI